MRAGEAFWSGQQNALQLHLDKRLPKCMDPGPWIRSAAISSGAMREGFGIKKSVMDDWCDRFGPYKEAWSRGMEVDIAATESTDRALTSVQRLDAELKKFREQTKNDLASMKAASERVQSEVSQMQAKYRQAQDLLISPEFERAIANAERMATALEAISRLSETKLSVAVFSGGKPAA